MKQVQKLTVSVLASCVLVLGALPGRTAPSVTADPPLSVPSGSSAESGPSDEWGWPRRINSGDTTLTIYQPQLDAWSGNQLTGRAAVAVQTSASATPTYGVIWFSARTEVDKGIAASGLTGRPEPRRRRRLRQWHRACGHCQHDPRGAAADGRSAGLRADRRYRPSVGQELHIQHLHGRCRPELLRADLRPLVPREVADGRLLELRSGDKPAAGLRAHLRGHPLRGYPVRQATRCRPCRARRGPSRP